MSTLEKWEIYFNLWIY